MHNVLALDVSVSYIYVVSKHSTKALLLTIKPLPEN